MKHISNQEKAKHLSSREMYGGFTLAEQNAAYCASMEMAEWKDEQEIEFLRNIVESMDLITTGNLSHRISNIKCMLFSRIALLSKKG